MKNILSILVVSLFLFGCSKSDDSPNDINDTSGSIIGIWKLKTQESSYDNGYIDPILGTEIVTDSFTDISTNNDTTGTYLVFRYDNTHTWYYYFLDTLQYEIDYTYVKDENVVSIYDSLLLASLQLTTLTDNNLNFYWDDTYTWVDGDTTFFENYHNIIKCVKSELSSITIEPLNKKNSVSGYNSFLNRRENR